MKIVIYSRFRLRRALFSAAVRLRFGLAALPFFFEFDIVSPTSRALLVAILWRRFAHAPDDTRVGDGRNGLLDPLHLDLMKPVVAEVEPVSEDTFRFKIQLVQRCRACVSVLFLPVLRTRKSI